MRYTPHLKNMMNFFFYKIIYILHESECDMVKYFKSRLIYFQGARVKIKPESEISNITLTSVISGLFHTRYLH